MDCYERFYCVHSNSGRENLSLRRHSREPSRVPFKELLDVFKKNRKLRQLTREHISNNNILVFKIHDLYTRAHVLCDVNAFRRECTCKHGSKRKSYKGSERRFNNPLLQKSSLRKSYKYKSEKSAKVIEKLSACFQRSQSKNKLL